MSDHRHRHFSRKHLARTLYGILIVFVLLTVNSAAVSLLTEAIFRFFHRTPPRLVNFPLQFLLTALAIALESQIFILLRPRRRDFFSQYIEAFRKIARGDFNIQVSSDEDHGRFSRLTGGFNEMAESLRKMEEMRQQFISDMSHEIQSPLTSIGGFARILREESLSEEKRNSYLTIIEEESRRLSRLSEELLEMTRLESPDLKLQPGEYSLDRQIREIILNYEPQWREKNLEIRADLPEVKIRADRDLLARVWSNLLHNAVKFTPAGRSLSVSVSRIPENGSGITAVFADEGAGIDPEDLPRIFDRFHKADKSRTNAGGQGGSGLGLAIVQKIVVLHGGTVTARSPGPDRGTVFTVKLPAGGPPDEGIRAGTAPFPG